SRRKTLPAGNDESGAWGFVAQRVAARRLVILACVAPAPLDAIDFFDSWARDDVALDLRNAPGVASAPCDQWPSHLLAHHDVDLVAVAGALPLEVAGLAPDLVYLCL